MFSIIAVTNRFLCERPLTEQIARLGVLHKGYSEPGDIELVKPDKLILREKDLPEGEYEILADEVIKLCKELEIECILHNFVKAAEKLEYNKIHLPLKVLMSNNKSLASFYEIGVSVHSVEEAQKAQELGAAYLIAGHIYRTDCKAGVPARGISFLRELCQAVTIPVYAIGGIGAEKLVEVQKAGAAGACIMSGYMKI